MDTPVQQQEVKADPIPTAPALAARDRLDQRRSADPAPPGNSRPAAIIVTLSVALIVVLSLWYAVRPQPLLVQGEADATRIDIAARVDCRVAERQAAVAASEANATLARQTYNRTKQLTERDVASVQKLDEATAQLDVAQ